MDAAASPNDAVKEASCKGLKRNNKMRITESQLKQMAIEEIQLMIENGGA